MKTLSVLLISFLAIQLSAAQDFRQTIRGRITDKESHAPIAFATISIENGHLQTGAFADSTGSYRITGVPVGRIRLHISMIGYESLTIPNLEVTTGKELIIDAEMTESIVKMAEVTVVAGKARPSNVFAPVSARTFSVEESHRYAGAGNDVSRMAMNFAGVKSTNDAMNEIVIRGNSPNNLVFRLEGADIPNPNHFGEGGASGGPVSMLNNNVLSNSDFLTGAFPAEYGNTTSGVFDLKMRNGNNEKHKFLAQFSTLGVELGAEGPLSGNKKSSYLVNYRYSTFKLMTDLGMKTGMGTAIPAYQDLVFKLYMPTEKSGTFSLFGLGGISDVAMLDSKRDTTVCKDKTLYEQEYEMDWKSRNYSGVLGLSHLYNVNNSTYTRLILSASTIANIYNQDSLSTINRRPFQQLHSDFTRNHLSARFYVNKKIDTRNTLRMGITADRQYSSIIDSTFDTSVKQYRTVHEFNAAEMLFQPYSQVKHRFSERMSLVIGFNSMYVTGATNFSFEPRSNLSWEYKPGHTISIAYGLHSFNTPVEVRNQKILLEDGTYSEPNRQLDFTKSHHFVVGFDKLISNKIRFKSELYYQYITDVPVEKRSSSYSLLNRSSLSTYQEVNTDSLVNKGNGYNCGIEITAEKFMDKGVYFLSTLSFFESKYRGSDRILRSTAFNGNYVFNLLGGKEFRISSHKNSPRFIRKITLDGKFNIAGGQRYSPVDLAASRAANTTKYDNTMAFTRQMPLYAKLDIRAGFKSIGKSSSKELAINISNVTNRRNPFYMKYDPETGNVKTVYQMGLMPDLLFRITF
jgi:hypothetical protein